MFSGGVIVLLDLLMVVYGWWVSGFGVIVYCLSFDWL